MTFAALAARDAAPAEADAVRPEIILGADLLNNLDAYAVDFGRAELQIRIPAFAR